MYIIKNEKLLKRVYLCLTVFLVACWSVGAVIFAYRYIQKEYVYPLEYKETVFKCADEFNLNRALIFAVIKTESNFDPNAKSKAGAVGLMQITPETGEYIANRLGIEEYSLTNAQTNIKFGCYYIRYLKDRFKQLDTALIAYNAGEGKVSDWLKNPDLSSDGITLKTVPYRESNEYIKKIHENFSKYKKLYGNILDK